MQHDARTAKAVAIMWTIAIAVVLLVPSSPSAATTWPYADKLVHIVLFAIFAIAWFRARTRWPLIAIGGVAVAVATELLQPLLPWPRRADPMDVAADIIGLAVGFACAVLWRNGRDSNPR